MTIEHIELWHQRVRPTPDDNAFRVQLGCHIEEICELFNAVDFNGPEGIICKTALDLLATGLKNGTIQVTITNRKELLDSLADQVVTAVGVGHCAGMKTSQAIAEVDRSNWSKFDSDGQPIFDENGKVKKGPHYFKPDLSAFV